MKPFWEESYADAEHETFGAASSEVVDLVGRLPPGARVLDAGCGDGRHALYLARAGFEVDAFDLSERGVAKLRQRAGSDGLNVTTWVQDLRTVQLAARYDLIVCHGVLHLLGRDERPGIVSHLQESTAIGGWNVVVAFTDRIPPPPDLAPFMTELFQEGELASLYDGWTMELSESYILHDEHPGGIRHRHAIDKVVARRRGEA
ncbi:MAG TPA: methyltransferase domain-containing protein [Longimicrobiales bacterium]|nr:methyltransferase domain-containing protein [Longimicrobiales bacterium]